jgi:hypothetical protein
MTMFALELMCSCMCMCGSPLGETDGRVRATEHERRR